MKHSKHITLFIAMVGIFLITSQIDATYSNSLDNAQYPIICESELGPLPKNLSFRREVDINSDGRIDIIADNSWGAWSLYINCGNDEYYRAILSNDALGVKPDKKNGWHSISIVYDSVIIDGQLYKYTHLPLEHEKDGKINEFYVSIEHDGISYKMPFSYSQKLGIHASRYWFDCNIHVREGDYIQKIDTIYFELSKNNLYQIKVDAQESYLIKGVRFADLNYDGILDAVLNYEERHGSGASEYSALLLNNGDNSFIFAGEIRLGRIGLSFPKPENREITINGSRFIAIVYQEPIFIRPGEEDEILKHIIPDKYDLYIYQPELKEFIHLPALPGKDKSTFIPLDKKKFEDIVNPPLLRKDPSRISKTDEVAILKLIKDYENTLIKAINNNDFSIVEKQLTPGSNLYKAQQDLVANLSKRGIQEKLIDYQVEKIETTGEANAYKVYVYEKIGIKRPGKLEFTASEFRWVYTVIFDNGKYTLSEISKWD
ncbi:MAG: hypothetical protein GXY86_03170, partial [Firmicutes bacterium]|nr:hypothetical protein [Bacillota bacterium]